MNSKVTVLVIDGGGRGSVLVDKYLQSERVSRVIGIPGNDLMGQGRKKAIKTFPKIKTTDIENISKICNREKVDLVDVCQDDAVAAGVTDALLKEGLKVFGPTKAAGRIEWDKAWARNFMTKFQIPSPSFKVCSSQKEGIGFIKSQKQGEWFIKASGLAAGKGALYAKDNQEALQSIVQMKSFGKAGQKFLIEKCLTGEEFSSFAIVDRKNFILLGHAQDHKQVFDGNLGPNTGGMGCSSPPMVITRKIEKQIMSIFKKTVEGLVEIGCPYRGILYLGGIVNKNNEVKVIEFNARWGDPEAQVLIPQINNDFYQLAEWVITEKIKNMKIRKDKYYGIVVTAASKGYPQNYSEVVGKKINGLGKILQLRTIKVFGAGVKMTSDGYLVGGGRLFYVMAKGKNVAQARNLAYNALSQVSIEGNNLHYRTDIGFRDLERFRH